MDKENLDELKKEIAQGIMKMSEEQFLDFVWKVEEMCVEYRLEPPNNISEQDLKVIEDIENFCTKALKENKRE